MSDPILSVVKDRIRVYLNDIADHMASGGCEKHEDYVRLVGKVEALALIERDILDLEQRLEDA
jgi:hypothetical protein